MDQEEIKKQAQGEIEKWQTKMDEAKVQMNLAAKEAQTNLKPHIEELEREVSQSKEKMKQLQSASGSALEDIHSGLRISFKAMEKAFSRASLHFKK